MFRPDYTETMSTLLDTIGKEKNDVLPREGLEANVARFMKRQNALSTVNEIKKSARRE